MKVRNRRPAAIVITVALIALAGLAMHARSSGKRPTDQIDTRNSSATAADKVLASQRALVRDGRPTMEQVRSRIDPQVFKSIGPRSYHISRLELRPPGDALEYVEALLARSKRGDALATFDIYLTVMECESYIRASIRPTTMQPGSSTPALGQLVGLDRKLAECAPLANDADLMSGSWLALAAEQGSIEARLVYTLDTHSVLGDARDRLANPEAVVAWRDNAHAYLEEVASTGNLDAILRLSSAYENGVIVQQNAELAYAYALASNRIKPGTTGTHLVRSMEKELSIKQRESAVVLSHQIYQSCCIP